MAAPATCLSDILKKVRVARWNEGEKLDPDDNRWTLSVFADIERLDERDFSPPSPCTGAITKPTTAGANKREAVQGVA